MVFALQAALIAAFGALLTGLASVLTALGALRKERRRGHDECTERIRDIERAFEAGLKMEKRK